MVTPAGGMTAYSTTRSVRRRRRVVGTIQPGAAVERPKDVTKDPGLEDAPRGR
jgi:hypothetical protein